MIDMPEQSNERKSRIQFFETLIEIKQPRYGFIVYPIGKQAYTSQLFETKEEAIQEARKIK